MVRILADTLTADMGLIPGLAGIGPAMGLPLSVLAAFLERPFYTLGGITRQTLWYSLQANLVSLAIGFVAMLIFAFLSDATRQYDALFDVWPFVAVAVSTIVEGRYLSRRQQPNTDFWVWTALGNVTSAAVCVGLLFLIVYLRDCFPRWRIAIAPVEVVLNLCAFAGSVILFVVAFRRTREVAAKMPPASAPPAA